MVMVKSLFVFWTFLLSTHGFLLENAVVMTTNNSAPGGDIDGTINFFMQFGLPSERTVRFEEQLAHNTSSLSTSPLWKALEHTTGDIVYLVVVGHGQSSPEIGRDPVIKVNGTFIRLSSLYPLLNTYREQFDKGIVIVLDSCRTVRGISKGFSPPFPKSTPDNYYLKSLLVVLAVPITKQILFSPASPFDRKLVHWAANGMAPKTIYELSQLLEDQQFALYVVENGRHEVYAGVSHEDAEFTLRLSALMAQEFDSLKESQNTLAAEIKEVKESQGMLAAGIKEVKESQGMLAAEIKELAAEIKEVKESQGMLVTEIKEVLNTKFDELLHQSVMKGQNGTTTHYVKF